MVGSCNSRDKSWWGTVIGNIVESSDGRRCHGGEVMIMVGSSIGRNSHKVMVGSTISMLHGSIVYRKFTTQHEQGHMPLDRKGNFFGNWKMP